MTNLAQNTTVSTGNKAAMLNHEIAQRWEKFNLQEVSAIRNMNDLVTQVQARYGLDEARAHNEVDAWAKDRQVIGDFAEFQPFGKYNFDAAMASAAALMRAAQAVASEWADYSRRAFELSAQTAEQMLAARSFERAFQIQQNYARAAYEDCAGEMTKIGQICRACAEDASRPFGERIAETSAKVAESSAKVAQASAKMTRWPPA